MSFGISAATAAVVGGGLAAAGAVGGALISANGAKKAAQAQGDAAAQQTQLQRDIYDQNREDQAPFRGAGYNALYGLMQGTGTIDPEQYARDRFLRDWQAQNPDMPAPGWDDPNVQAQLANYKASLPALYGQSGDLTRKFTAQDFQTDPGYQFRLGEGQKQIESSAAARGGLLSGAAAKALTKYNQNFASNEYGNVFNRFQTEQGNKFNRLASLAGVGQTATNATQQAGQNYATGASNALQYGGNARASGYAGQSNALSAGLGGLSSAFNNFGGSSTYGSPYGNYSAQTSPVTDYYAGTQPTQYLS